MLSRAGSLFLLLFFWLALGLAVGGPARALDLASVPWQIAADRISRLKDPGRIVAEGNVVLTREEPGALPLVIEGDWLQYEEEIKLVTARGHLRIRSGEDVLFAEEVVLDLSRQTGSLKEAALLFTRNNFYLTGSLIEKTGEATYRVEDGRVTTCLVGPGRTPPWSMKSDQARVTVDGYAVLTGATLRIKDVPLLYLPYLVLPAKTSRQSGLLFPEISQSSRSGIGVLTPLFINFSPSSDMTLYPGYLSRRGPVASLEMRYVADYGSMGTFLASFLQDRREDTAADEYKSDGYLRTRDDRFWLRGKMDHDFGDGLKGKVDLDVVSDRDYLEEFQKGLIGYDRSELEFNKRFRRGFQEKTIPFRETTTQLAKSWPAMHLGGELRAVDDVSDVPAPDTALQALPRIVFAGRRSLGPATPLALDWESEYVHYWRHEGLGAHRLDLHPRISAPLPLGAYIEGTVGAGLRETLYQVEAHGDPQTHAWPADNFQDRTLVDFSANLATTLVRDFETRLGPVRSVRHLLRPELEYSYIPARDQDELPDLDVFDRIPEANQITYALSNFFSLSGKLWEGARHGRHAGRLKVSQTYDLKEAGRAPEGQQDARRPFSDVLFEFEANPTADFSVRYDTTLSLYGRGVTSYDLLSRYVSHRGDSLSLDYRYSRIPGVDEPYFFVAEPGESLHELNVACRTQLMELVSAEYSLTHSWSTGRTVESSLRLIYHPPCWSTELLFSRTPDDNRIALMFSLSGIGRILELGLPQL